MPPSSAPARTRDRYEHHRHRWLRRFILPEVFSYFLRGGFGIAAIAVVLFF